MFKLACIFAIIAVASAGNLFSAPLVATAPVAAVPAPFVTSKSSQVIARNYNTFAAAPLAVAPAHIAYSAPAVAAPLAYSAPAIASSYAYSAPAIASPYAYSAYSAPLSYHAAAPLILKK